MGAKLGGSGAVNDINVTPLIDVMLVLLIIFMVVTPMLSNNVNVVLPTAESPTPGQDKGQHVVVSVDADGELYMGKSPIELEDLVDQVNEEYQKNPSRSVLIRGDKNLRYGQVRQVMDTLGESGMTTVQLAVENPAGSQ